jgi:acetylornithine aminotransferase
MSRIFWYPGYELLATDIVRAEGCYLYDSDGKKYLDLESGVWCTCIGHGHPRMLRVLTEQSERICHTGFIFSSHVLEEAATELLSLFGFDGGKCVFLCSGSESVEYGVRVAQAISERPLLMTMADSYFGAYGSAMRRSEDEWFSFDWFECAGCTHSEPCTEDCEHWAVIPFDRIGGFLLEPGSSSGLVRFPPTKLVRRIVETVKDGGGSILINEVTTGIGRTGRWFGYEHYDISPDIVALGKGVGNGYPVSVTAFAPGVVGKLGGEAIEYAQSHQNDPLGAAVATEVIRVIREEELIERGRAIGEMLGSGLEKIKHRTGRIREIRQRGLLIAVEVEDGLEAAYADLVLKRMVERGYMMARRPGLSVLRIDPPLTIQREDIEEFLSTFEDVLSETQD